MFGDLDNSETEKSSAVEVDIALPLHWTEVSSVQSAMQAVFLGPGEPLTNSTPQFLDVYFGKRSARFDTLPGTDIPIHDSKEPGVVPPKATYSPEPEYNEQARRAKYSATVEFIVIVGADGAVKTLQITKPAGMGLDEQAVAALSTWKFTPGTKDGNPAAVRIGVEVCFSLQTDSTCN